MTNPQGWVRCAPKRKQRKCDIHSSQPSKTSQLIRFPISQFEIDKIFLFSWGFNFGFQGSKACTSVKEMQQGNKKVHIFVRDERKIFPDQQALSIIQNRFLILITKTPAMSELKTNLRDTFIGKIWKFLWVLHEEEGPQVQRHTNTCQ